MSLTPEELDATLEQLQVAQEELVAARNAVEAERQRYQELFECALTEHKRIEAALCQANEELKKEIAEREQAESALRESEAQYRRIIETTIEGVWVIDAQNKTTFVNSQMAQMLGYIVDEMLGVPLFAFMDEESVAIARFYLERRRQGIEERHDFKFRRRDGSELWTSLSTSTIFDQAGQYAGALAMATDITEHKRIEEIRRAIEKEQELSQLKLRFFSMASHEFRTPLSTILLSAQLLKHFNDECPKEKQLKNIQRIEANAKNMIQLLEDILTINRAESGNLEFNQTIFDLEEFCRNLIEQIQLNAGNQYAINLVIQGSCKNAYMDENLLRSILANLLSNAIKYSPGGGNVHFALICEQGEAIFRIRDEGLGISPEDQQQMFEPFHRGNNVGTIAGTGLGLTVVKKCVDICGGKITIASAVGMGTTSTITLPLNFLQK